ncbi:MAG: D-alanine--D-alanine ligase [Chitinophagaceae bacterium]|nr:D-alanine--D-alanine ligase [Oligoflexus sp.]
MSKPKAIVIYGGRSTEHEVSCRSASYIFKNIDRSRYDAYAFAVDKSGVWHAQNRAELETNIPESLPVAPHEKGDAESKTLLDSFFAREGKVTNTVVFNIIHGTTGEDGCLQGFFDLKDVAYVGPSLLGSAIAMDKVVAKQLAEAAGVAIVPYLAIRTAEWEKNGPALLSRAEHELRFPIFVKPASLGSSVGIRKAANPYELKDAVAYAFEFDERILLETGMNVREIEYACLGGYDPAMSVAGEVGVDEGFYSYEEKYSKVSKATVNVPAHLDAKLAAEGSALAKKVFEALNLYGLARIDLFLDKKTNQFYFNEANTLPGFTSISQYPKLWEHAGYSGQQLIGKLLDLALERRQKLNRLTRSVDTAKS